MRHGGAYLIPHMQKIGTIWSRSITGRFFRCHYASKRDPRTRWITGKIFPRSQCERNPERITAAVLRALNYADPQRITQRKIGESCKTFFVRIYDREVMAAVYGFESARELHALCSEIGFQNYRFMMGKRLAWSTGIECQRLEGAIPLGRSRTSLAKTLPRKGGLSRSSSKC